jgi:hypothetical protein
MAVTSSPEETDEGSQPESIASVRLVFPVQRKQGAPEERALIAVSPISSAWSLDGRERVLIA